MEETFYFLKEKRAVRTPFVLTFCQIKEIIRGKIYRGVHTMTKNFKRHLVRIKVFNRNFIKSR